MSSILFYLCIIFNNTYNNSKKLTVKKKNYGKWYSIFQQHAFSTAFNKNYSHEEQVKFLLQEFFKHLLCIYIYYE